MHTILKGQNKSIIGGLHFMDFCFPVNQVVYSKTSKIWTSIFRNTHLFKIWNTLNSKNRSYSWSILIKVYNNICFGYVKETDVSFTHPELLFDRKTKLMIIIIGGYIFSCIPFYNLNLILIIRKKTFSTKDIEYKFHFNKNPLCKCKTMKIQIIADQDPCFTHIMNPHP